MTEFISLLVSYVLMAIADSVDDAFGNSISIDTVIVIGCMASISLITRALSRIGAYYYRVIRDNDIKCIQMDFIAGGICGLVLFMLKDFVVSMYDITAAQQELLRSVLIQWSIFLPCYGAGNTSFEIVRLRSKLKLYSRGLLYYYVLLIVSDAIIYFNTGNLAMLYAATTMCQVFAIIYFYIKMKFDWELIDFKFIRQVLAYGTPIAVERFISGFALMLYGVLASRMGNTNYSIHAVCYGAAKSGEQVTNAYNAALMIKLPRDKSYKESLNSVHYWAKRMILIMVPIYLSYSILSISIYHGKVSLSSCFPWYIFYMLEFIGLYIYENYKVLCMNQKYVKVFPIGVLAGLVFRLSVCSIGLNTSIPLVFFGIGSSFDWACRGIVYYTTLRYNKTKY